MWGWWDIMKKRVWNSETVEGVRDRARTIERVKERERMCEWKRERGDKIE